MWDHFTDQKDADGWLHDVAELPKVDLVGDIPGVMRRGSVALIKAFLVVLEATDAAADDGAPPGWSDAELLAGMVATAGGEMVIE